MSNDSKRVSELGIVTTLANTDRVVVLTNPNTSAQTQTITLKNFATSLTVNALPIANSTQLGIIKIGPGLAVAANGVVTAPLPLANGTTAGVVQIGDGISVDANGIISTSGANTGNVVFLQYDAPWNDTYPAITTKVSKDLNILGNNSAVNISSNQYVQMVYSQGGEPYGSGNNQSYNFVAYGYTGNYIQSDDNNANLHMWVEKDLYANGESRTYGQFSNDTVSYNYGYSIQPAGNYGGYGMEIHPSGAFQNKLTIFPTADYDIHLFESGSNGAVTLGGYGWTNFRVYGPGGANNGGGLYGNDIRADLAANAVFQIKTYDVQDRVWQFNPDGSTLLPLQSSSTRTGSGEFLKLPNDGYQKIIGTDNGTAGRNTVDRLVISGGDGFDNGEGGDIYLWAGKSGANGGSGGDIKVDGGQGYNGSEGGTIKIRGGSSDTGTGGFVEIWTGSGSSGAPITLSAWNGGGWNQWQFQPHGNMTLPSGGDIKNYDGFSVIKSIPQNLQSSAANYELVLSDAGKHIYKTDGQGYSIGVPTDASVAFEIGTAITIVSGSSWTYVYAVDSETTAIWGAGFNQSLASWYLPENSMATLLKIDVNKWMLSGAGLAVPL